MTLARAIFARTRRASFQRYVRNLLVELCRIDTTPRPDVKQLQSAEEGCFRILERELSQLKFPGGGLERRPINPAIRNHPQYSLLHSTKTPERPQGLTPEEAYDGRFNLLFSVPGARTGGAGQAVALNAHVDVVAPFFPPRARGGVVLGRGACDDKGPVVSIVAALKVLSEVLAESGLRLNRNVLAMFVIEEETGGNGSLSLAMDRQLKSLYDCVLVGECTGLKIHPANRGAVWYRAELKQLTGISLLELAAFVIEALEQEGVAIRAESRHPLFPQRPVQTCHGVIGPFGEHPSRICGEVSFTIDFGRAPGAGTEALIGDCLESGLADYTGRYGDKAKVMDPATGRPMVARHYRVSAHTHGFTVRVYGAAGHMGAVRERDGAITKMAQLVRSLVFSRTRIEHLAGAPMRLELTPDAPPPEGSGVGSFRQPRTSLVLEGGQGFVPTHGIGEIMDRLRRAAQRGAETCLRLLGRREPGADTVTMTYEKLHNVAFDGAPNSPMVRNAIAAAKACGLWKNEPVLGWTVSCDARLFATEYPGMEVLTFGPGQLAHAHSDHEQIALDEIRRAAELLALFLLCQTGTTP